MNHTHRRLRDLPVGARLVVGHGRSFWPEGMLPPGYAAEGLRILTVVRSGPGGLVVADEKGVEARVALDAEGRATDWRLNLLWSDALPALDREAAKAYAGVVIAGGANAVLLHVASVADGVADCRLVEPAGFRAARSAHDDGFDEEEAWAGTVSGNAALWGVPVVVERAGQGAGPGKPGEAALRAGDLVAAAGLSCRIEGGRTLTRLRGAQRIANLAVEELGRVLPWGVGETAPAAGAGEGPEGLAAYGGPAGYRAYRKEEEVARVRLEPSEALALWLRVPGSPEGQGRTACTVLASSGIAFHEVDCPADYFHGDGIEEGLWVMRDARAWSDYSNGDYDSGIDGDWTPATEEDLARFGFTLASASKEVADVAEIDVDPGLAAEMIAKAEAAAAADAPAP